MSLGEGRKGHVRLRVSCNQNHGGLRVHVVFGESECRRGVGVSCAGLARAGVMGARQKAVEMNLEQEGDQIIDDQFTRARLCAKFLLI